MDTKTSPLPVRLYLCRTLWRTTDNGKRLVFSRFHVREALSEVAAKHAEHVHNKAHNQGLVADGWTPTVCTIPLLHAETPAEFTFSTQEEGDKPVRRFRVRVEEILSTDLPVDPDSIPHPAEEKGEALLSDDPESIPYQGCKRPETRLEGLLVHAVCEETAVCP